MNEQIEKLAMQANMSERKVELRWVWGSEPAPEFGENIARSVKVLQYRETEWKGVEAYDWSEWKDVPTVVESMVKQRKSNQSMSCDNMINRITKMTAEQELYAALEESHRWHWGDKYRDSPDPVERALWVNRNEHLKTLLDMYKIFRRD